MTKKPLYPALNYSILSYDAMVYPGCQQCPHEMGLVLVPSAPTTSVSMFEYHNNSTIVMDGTVAVLNIKI